MFEMFPCYCSHENSPASNRGRRGRLSPPPHGIPNEYPNEHVDLLGSALRARRQPSFQNGMPQRCRNRTVFEAVLHISRLPSSRLVDIIYQTIYQTIYTAPTKHSGTLIPPEEQGIE